MPTKMCVTKKLKTILPSKIQPTSARTHFAHIIKGNNFLDVNL